MAFIHASTNRPRSKPSTQPTLPISAPKYAALLCVLLNRLTDRLDEVESLAQMTRVVRCASLMTSAINRMIKTEQLLSGSSNDFVARFGPFTFSHSVEADSPPPNPDKLDPPI
jgi:hypothetical protein